MSTLPTININELTRQHKLFVEAYCGDHAEAAAIAGYSGTPEELRAKGMRLLSNAKIQAAIKERSKYLNKMGNAIAQREERQMFWTSIMNNNDPHRKQEKDVNGIPIPEGNIPMNMRLKASELLGKSEGDFIDRIDINHNITISDIVKESYDAKDVSLEDIEAQYNYVQEQKKLAKPSSETVVEYEEVDEDTHEQPIDLGDLI